MVDNLRTQLAESEATGILHASGLESMLRDIGGAVVFRAMLNDEEVTVNFTIITRSEEAVVTIRYADRRKVKWHDKLVKCMAAINKWDWFLCMDQGLGKPAYHLYNLMDEDVAELPASLRRQTERGACYCRDHSV